MLLLGGKITGGSRPVSREECDVVCISLLPSVPACSSGSEQVCSAALRYDMAISYKNVPPGFPASCNGAKRQQETALATLC